MKIVKTEQVTGRPKTWNEVRVGDIFVFRYGDNKDQTSSNRYLKLLQSDYRTPFSIFSIDDNVLTNLDPSNLKLDLQFILIEGEFIEKHPPSTRIYWENLKLGDEFYFVGGSELNKCRIIKTGQTLGWFHYATNLFETYGSSVPVIVCRGSKKIQTMEEYNELP
jgi:hypothetical protein